MSKKDKTKPENYDIIYESKFLYLNCPKCQNIPYLSFNSKNSELINIKCDKCHNSSEINLNDYLKGLSTKIESKTKKCENHKNFFDKYCYNCHIQFCSKCETSKFPKNKHYFIINDLLKPYIHNMKAFFHFCDCILLNYDIEYPDYYQQINLKNLLSVLNEKTILKDFKEPKLERLFKYNNNNFIKKEKNVEDSLILLSSLNDFKDKITKALLVDDELIIIIFKDCLKLYDYKNKTCISKLKIDLSADEIKLSKISKDNIGILFNNNNYNYILKIYSISFNKIILEKFFDFYINNIKNINNNSFGIIKNNSLEVYSLVENFQSLELQKITNIEIPYIIDFIHLSNENYIIALTKNSIIVYSKDFNIMKKIEQNEEFKTIYETKDRHIILGGRVIGLFNINDLSYSLLFDDNIPKLKMSYLSGVETYIEYSHFNLTYFNRLICNQKFKKILRVHYDDVDDEVVADEKNICIFNYNPENCKMTLAHINKNLKPKSIYINKEDELIIVKDSCVNVYNLK